MKKTTKSLALARTTIAVLSSTNLARIAGGRWNDPGPSEWACETQRYCNETQDTYTADCATWKCSRFLECQ